MASIRSRLVNAIKISSFVEITEAVNAGAHPDTADETGETALMKAAKQGNAACLSLLLSHGANPSVSRPDGWSATMWAVANGHGEALGILLAAGADPNSKAHDRSAVMESVRALSVQCLERLIEKQADIEYKDNKGLTAIFIACQSRSGVECLKLLLRAGASPNVADNNGVTPAMVAAIYGNAEGVGLLLAAGADPGATDKDGWSAARHATHHKRADIGRALDEMSRAMREKCEISGGLGEARARAIGVRI